MLQDIYLDAIRRACVELTALGLLTRKHHDIAVKIIADELSRTDVGNTIGGPTERQAAAQ